MSESDVSEQFTPTDMRRAAAMLSHYRAGDVAGLFAVMAEAEMAGASADLAAAMCALFFQLSPELMTEDGGTALQVLACRWAAVEAAS